MDPREDDRDFARRRTTVDHLRADYDDNFGLARTPFEVARGRLLIPGIAHIIIGILGILGMLALGVGVIVNFLAPWRHITDIVAAIYAGLILTGVVLFALVITGGVSMLRMRRRWLCLYAAYAATSLSLFPVYSILFCPFGIWGLIVLYRPDVREQFRRPPPPRDDGHGEL